MMTLQTTMGSYRKSRNVANRLGSSLRKSFNLRRKTRLDPADSSSWWRTIKCLLGGKRDSAAALQPLAKSTSEGNMRLLADKINDFFQSVAAPLPPLTANSPFLSAECNVPDKYVITVDEVESRLACLNPGKATGPDDIPTWVLRDFAPFLASPLCAVFNSSIRDGYVPDLWRSAHVIPLPRKTPPTQIESDLRPVSLTPVMSKVLKHFICKWAREAVAPNIHPRQFGAVQGSSTAHALVEMLHYIQRNLDTPGRHVRMLLLDYSKAFDLVNHNILLEKMQRAGNPACLVRWCAAFLLSSRQCVRVGCDLSDMATLSGGAPQGTLLGPLAFILHLGDFDTPGPVEDYIYVDDTSCCLASSDPLDPHIQNAADYSEVWASSNDMRINSVKTKEMVFSFCRSLDLAPITIGNKVIERVARSRLLGVTLCSDLSWNGHIDSVLSKCNQRLYLSLHLRRSGYLPRTC